MKNVDFKVLGYARQLMVNNQRYRELSVKDTPYLTKLDIEEMRKIADDALNTAKYKQTIGEL